MDPILRRRAGKGQGSEESIAEPGQQQLVVSIEGAEAVRDVSREVELEAGPLQIGDGAEGAAEGHVTESVSEITAGAAETLGVQMNPFWSQKIQDEARLAAARPAHLDETASDSTEMRQLEETALPVPKSSPVSFGPSHVGSGIQGATSASSASVENQQAPGLRPGERRILTEMKDLMETIMKQNAELSEQNTGLRQRIDKLEEEKASSQQAWRSGFGVTSDRDAAVALGGIQWGDEVRHGEGDDLGRDPWEGQDVLNLPFPPGRDPFNPGDRTFWNLPTLEGVHLPSPATRAGDWLAQIRPLLCDLSEWSQLWWSRVEWEAQALYRQWSRAPAIQKGMIQPRLSVELTHVRLRRLESRAYGMLQSAVPQAIRDELLATRSLHCVGLLFQILKVYAPGGLQERAQVLTELTNLGHAKSASDVVNALRAWSRCHARAVSMGVMVPDPALILRGVDSLVDSLSRKAANAQVAFRLSVARNQLQIDHHPSMVSVIEYMRVLQSEWEQVSVSGQEATSGPPKVARMDTDQGNGGKDGAAHTGDKGDKGGKGAKGEGKKGEKGETAPKAGGGATHPLRTAAEDEWCRVTHPVRGLLNTNLEGNCPVVDEFLCLELIEELETFQSDRMQQALALRALNLGARSDSVDFADCAWGSEKEVLEWLRGQFRDWPEHLLRRALPARCDSAPEGSHAFMSMNRRHRRAVERADTVVLHLFSGSEKGLQVEGLGSKTVILRVDERVKRDILDEKTYSWLASLCSSGKVSAVVACPPSNTFKPVWSDVEKDFKRLRGPTRDQRFGLLGNSQAEQEWADDQTVMLLRTLTLHHLAHEARPGEPEQVSCGWWHWPELAILTNSWVLYTTLHARTEWREIQGDPSAQWQPSVLHAVGHAIQVWKKETVRDRDERLSEDQAALKALTKEEIEFREHCEKDHIIFRKDCKVCLQAAMRGPRHIRQKYQHSNALCLNLDLIGPWIPGRDHALSAPARHILVATLGVPVFRDGNPLPLQPEDKKEEKEGLREGEGSEDREEDDASKEAGGIGEWVIEDESEKECEGEEEPLSEEEYKRLCEEQDEKWRTIAQDLKDPVELHELTFAEPLVSKKAEEILDEPAPAPARRITGLVMARKKRICLMHHSTAQIFMILGNSYAAEDSPVAESGSRAENSPVAEKRPCAEDSQGGTSMFVERCLDEAELDQLLHEHVVLRKFLLEQHKHMQEEVTVAASQGWEALTRPLNDIHQWIEDAEHWLLWQDAEQLRKSGNVSSDEKEVLRNLEDWKGSIGDELGNVFDVHQAMRRRSESELQAFKDAGEILEIIPSKALFQKKGGSGRHKCRVVACGNYAEGSKTKSRDRKLQCYAGGADSLSLRCHLRAAGHRAHTEAWRTSGADIRTAFLLAPLRQQNKRIILRPPTVLKQAGCVAEGEYWEITGALYGLQDSPADWAVYRDETLPTIPIVYNGQTTYLKQSKYDPNLWLLRCPESSKLIAALTIYVDDLLLSGTAEASEAVWSGIKAKTFTVESSMVSRTDGLEGRSSKSKDREASDCESVEYTVQF
ncbi:GIP [Symbiodinium sp. CCMP2592]|nr:GIP [Symbiodinium sp. CCMP2592]